MVQHPEDEPAYTHEPGPGGAALRHAQALIDRRRWDVALQQLNDALAAEPDNGYAHGLRAWCLLNLRRENEAENAARETLRLAPDWPFAHWVMGELRFRRRETKEALKSAVEGLKLEPYNSDLHALVAAVHAVEGERKESLAAAEQALAADPHNLRAANLRVLALRNLGRRREATEAVGAALSLHPTEASVHAGKGWDSLHRGRRDEALDHFQEALRLDPQLDWAREGVLDVLRAQNPVCRVLLAWRLWLERGGPTTWAILFVLIYLPMLAYALVHDMHGGLILMPVAVVITVTLARFLPWIAESLFNFALLFKPRARFVLNEDETRLAKLTVALSVVGGILAGAGAVLDSRRLLFTGLFVAAQVLPLTGLFHARPNTKGRKFMRDLFMLIVICGVAGAVVPGRASDMLFFYAGLGTAASVWLTTVAIRRYGAA